MGSEREWQGIEKIMREHSHNWYRTALHKRFTNPRVPEEEIKIKIDS